DPREVVDELIRADRILNALLRRRAYRAETARRGELRERCVGHAGQPELRWKTAAETGAQLMKQSIVVGETEFVQLVCVQRVSPVAKEADGPTLCEVRARARVAGSAVGKRAGDRAGADQPHIAPRNTVLVPEAVIDLREDEIRRTDRHPGAAEVIRARQIDGC